MIELKGVCKTLDDKNILKDINLSIKEGSIFGLIGHNGAGKTTLIKCLTGIYNVDKGQIKIDDKEVFQNKHIKNIVGYVPDFNNQFSNLKVKELIKLYELSYTNFNKERFYKLNKFFKIPENIRRKKLSKGMKTRLAIMLNLSIMPKVLVMDEPTSGLDPLIKKVVMNIILDDVSERGTTVLISSHNLSDLERICDSVAIMGDGEIKYSNSIEEMKENIKKIQVVFKEEAPKDLSIWKGVMNIQKVGRVYNIVINGYNHEILSKLKNSNIVFHEFIDLSLEDMFIYSVGGDSEYEELFK
ncbi:ABC transporter ATP-binding protein YtrB [Clostridium acetireducens DSM 10703]|uniref:ABC transporter ATP-binding protein YtrB n=1 Tax=Clostridium acetireducens DSM 10703 TaxID=1121290 RepID=A0A1E8EYM6_9CLOT|nr:ABC transporter ATP-binding protein [Clostridium acetireducens]OFI06071.1 ABC transporter ATP-binding protein YtrB [Clostridium acetireducens DSM 10703]